MAQPSIVFVLFALIACAAAAVALALRLRPVYVEASRGRRVAILRPSTYAQMVRLWRWRRRMVRAASLIEDLVLACDRSPKLRRAVRLALRVKGHAAES